jgi:hypothetical protein
VQSSFVLHLCSHEHAKESSVESASNVSTAALAPTPTSSVFSFPLQAKINAEKKVIKVI